jgi:wyosine [tRNA(Phe)-imidazoG37] synthetase (radical SAM superfamily)
MRFPGRGAAGKDAGKLAGNPPRESYRVQQQDSPLLTFGPVPSRRLGRSLGINNIPAKHCSYSCLYCQVGPTAGQEDAPRAFYLPQEIQRSVAARVEAAHRSGEPIDALTFVPDGEPTLDVNLGESIDMLRPLGIKIAVISNASMIWRKEVRSCLRKADWVSLKVDATCESVWQTINQPHPALRLTRILDGIKAFAQAFDGFIATETMLVAGVNDNSETIGGVADFLAELGPDMAYLAVPTRPPARADVRPPDELILVRAYEILKSKVANVEYLIADEGDAFALAGSAEAELLAITAVHPMRREAVETLLAKANVDWELVDRLEAEGKLRRVAYADRTFYVRRFPAASGAQHV